jgi:hypothetical protein
MASDDEARKALDGLTTYGGGMGLVGPGNVAALLRYAARAKAEALREAADAVGRAPLATSPGYEYNEPDAEGTRSNCVAAIRAMAAKLDGGTDGL